MGLWLASPGNTQGPPSTQTRNHMVSQVAEGLIGLSFIRKFTRVRVF